MKRFDYSTALNQLSIKKSPAINSIKTNLIPDWVNNKDFVNLFLPYLKILGDSREQDHWIEKACKYYNIAFEWCMKDKKMNTENLKEGDYTFQVIFPNKQYNFVGVVAYERKGAASEFYGNCINNRNRLKREFERFDEKDYKKRVLMLEFGESLTDLIDLNFHYYSKEGLLVEKKTKHTMYSTIMSWKQPNFYNFDIIQSNSHTKLFWLMIQDMYYFFRQEIRLECERKNLIEE